MMLLSSVITPLRPLNGTDQDSPGALPKVDTEGTDHVRTNDLTAPIVQVPGHTMQVDWAGTRMGLTDPISRRTTAVSVFVASLPFSGLLFAYGCRDCRVHPEPDRLERRDRATRRPEHAPPHIGDNARNTELTVAHNTGGDTATRCPHRCYRIDPTNKPDHRYHLSPFASRCPAMPLQHRHGYAAGIHRGLRTGQKNRERSCPRQGVGARC